MDEIIGVVASAAGGGLTGIIGSTLGRLAQYFERKQVLAHERLRWGHEIELQTLQLSASQAETEAELAHTTERGRWSGLQASLAAEAEIAASYRWVEAVRGLTRPFLTLLLWIIVAGLWIGAGQDQHGQIIDTVTFAATAATLWWFGDRAIRAKP